MIMGFVAKKLLCNLLYSLLLSITLSPPVPVQAANEFPVYRMSQFDVNGVSYGCRTSSLSLEAKSTYSWRTSRHCVVTDIGDLTSSMFDEIRQKAGGLVILLPSDLSILSADSRKHIASIEQYMLSQAVNIPVYFAQATTELTSILNDLKVVKDNNTTTTTAFGSFLETISANSYQFTVSGYSHALNKQTKTPILQGELLSGGNTMFRNADAISDSHLRMPTIVITTHLRTFGLYNAYQYNSDVAVLMSIVDVFSKLYNSKLYLPKYRLLFLVTESGPLLNFHATKKWLEEYLNLQNIDFVLCLDTIVDPISGNAEELFMHVSKPPREGTAINSFYMLLKDVAQNYNETYVESIHKKINLNDQQLQWEHERFSIKRLPSFTLSSLKYSKVEFRNTIFKESENSLLRKTNKMTNILIEALAQYIYKNDMRGNIISGSMVTSENLVKGYLNTKSALHNNDIRYAFEKYLQNVKLIYDKPDSREPEFMFYDGKDAKLNVYHVKPAVFDLLLTLFITCYITLFYFAVQMFPKVYDSICSLSSYAKGQNTQYLRYDDRFKKKSE